MTAPDEPVALSPVDELTITVLMDNTTDLLLTDEPPAHRPSMLGKPSSGASIFTGPGRDVMRAEHGFSALVTLNTDTTTHRVLFDTGITADGMVDNMGRLDIDPGDIEALVMSHGHFDHTGGLAGFVDAVGRRNLPVVLHPDFWLRRRVAPSGSDAVEIPTTSRAALRDTGFEILERRQPSFLLDGSLLVTGEVRRSTSFEQGFLSHQAFRGGEWVPDPLILDDQGLVAHLRNRGLVIITGCGHAGIVNIVQHARDLTGIEEIHAIVGGFHLSGPLFAPIIDPTVDALSAVGPDVIFPGHCTGWRAQMALSRALPDAYVHPSVGTRLELVSA